MADKTKSAGKELFQSGLIEKLSLYCGTIQDDWSFEAANWHKPGGIMDTRGSGTENQVKEIPSVCKYALESMQ